MDIKNIKGSLYTDWQWLLRQCQTDASVSKSSSQDVKQMKQKIPMSMEERCGHVCPSQAWLETYRLTSGRKKCLPTWLNLGTVHRMTTRLWNSGGANPHLGYVKLTEIFTPDDTCSQWTTQTVKSQTIQPNISRVMLWC